MVLVPEWMLKPHEALTAEELRQREADLDRWVADDCDRLAEVKAEETAEEIERRVWGDVRSIDVGGLRTTLRKRLQRLRRKKVESTDPEEQVRAVLLGRVLDGEPFVHVPDAAFPHSGPPLAPLYSEGRLLTRDEAITKMMRSIAYTLPQAEALQVFRRFAALGEILRPSLTAMLHKWPHASSGHEPFTLLRQQAHNAYSLGLASRMETDADRAIQEAEIRKRRTSFLTKRGR